MFKKIALILIISLLALSAGAKPLLKIGSQPPDFTLSDLNGRNVTLSNYLGSNVVVLSFFASWSKSCQQEIELLQELAKKYNYRDLKIIGISYDRNRVELKSFVETNKLSFTVLHDRKLMTLRDYRILIIPTLVTIDQSGNISSIYVDYDPNVDKALRQEIGELLKPSKK
jgi:peroxiredoxin